MMANCSDNVYVIKYTDKSKGTITITKSSLVTNLVDIALVGKSRLDYGEIFNENILHLLENFACPANGGNGDPNSPDTAIAFGTLLSNPVDGQKWYNSTANRLYIYNKTQEIWVPQGKQGDVAGNAGIIAHGSFLPRPVGPDGYVFPYSECNFVVSQHSSKSVATDTYLPSNTEIDYMRCFVSANGQVTMQFRYRGESSLREGYANYQIIGIRGESNTPLISVTPYVVPNPTPGVSSTPTPTPTPTHSSTPTPTAAASATPAASVAVSPTRTVTPTPTVSNTRAATPTPTPSRSHTPTPTPSTSAQPVVNLTGLGVQAPHPTNYMGTARAAYYTYGDGTGARQSTKTGSVPFTWLTNGTASNYQIRATLIDTMGTTEGTFGTWLNMGTTHYWAATQNGNGTNETQIKLEVRLASTSAIVDTVTIMLTASIGTPV